MTKAAKRRKALFGHMVPEGQVHQHHDEEALQQAGMAGNWSSKLRTHIENHKQEAENKPGML